ncbi:bifunctional DNA-binding transcriptional regulator/O6-methylguanine-DNA methyltransferase Ada [Acuticoccus sp.]|uniref:bifunctional DNA-binding transcriptional regulator/O6-methylguanine-DNA methyltransferase Ada n=1 Tax=Acuticoccus sp. TaxID=1904378 RepID=UPI003B516FA2
MMSTMSRAAPSVTVHATATSADPRWDAVLARDGDADGAFVFAVTTTGIYCRPSCPARRPRPQNVRYFALAREAEAAGYRACLRCRPTEPSAAQRHALAVEAACRMLQKGDMTLAELAAAAGMSAHHFHRLFRAHTGLTPKAYAQAVRTRRSVAALGEGGTVADAAFAAGYGSLSRFYAEAAARLGMSPSVVATGGIGELILTAQRRAPLGVVTAAFSARGVCAVVLSEGAQEGVGEVLARLPLATVLDGGPAMAAALDAVVGAVEEPRRAEELPLDIRGTAFEERVWGELRRIPAGTTRSYREVAEAIGAPTAHRAVARACGANRIAVLVPCHRVVRADGGLGGYRWGLERKRALLAREAEGG